MLRTLISKASSLLKKSSMKCLYGRQFGWRSHVRSKSFIEGHIFDSINTSIPWYTYSAISYLSTLNLRDLRVLEYGSGSSTKFFLDSGVKSIIAIEHDLVWYKRLSMTFKGIHNLEYLHMLDKKDYISAKKLSQYQPDIVSIDGKYRKECSNTILEYVNTLTSKSKKPLLIILDNSDWHHYSFKILASIPGYIPIQFYGYGPLNTYAWCTTLFINKEDNSHIFEGAEPRPIMTGLRDNDSEIL